jgi:uncharacterized protein with HEPN domain
MSNNKLLEIIKIADIHAGRVSYALNKLQAVFPIEASQLNNLSEENFLFSELLISRFAKLQDILGAKLIDLFLLQQGETIENLTMLDKINRLEALNIIADANLWLNMREARNHVAHEYPDNPELTAKYLNQIVMLAPKLIDLFNNIKNKSSN